MFSDSPVGFLTSATFTLKIWLSPSFPSPTAPTSGTMQSNCCNLPEIGWTQQIHGGKKDVLPVVVGDVGGLLHLIHVGQNIPKNESEDIRKDCSKQKGVKLGDLSRHGIQLVFTRKGILKQKKSILSHIVSAYIWLEHIFHFEPDSCVIF